MVKEAINIPAKLTPLVSLSETTMPLQILVIMCAQAVTAYQFGELSTCKVSRYTYMPTRTDSDGRQCWDTLTIHACKGRCESLEFADWRFPYKRSVHSVCVHGARELVKTQLRFCDPGADDGLRDYEYFNALSCSCQICDSTDTSCEGF